MTATAAHYHCTIVTEDGVEPAVVSVAGGVAMLTSLAGSGRSPIQVGCRGGGCGVCRVQVLKGDYETDRMSRRFVSEADEACGYALACRLIPNSDLTVNPAPLRR